jgi:hypothetical protein
LTRSVEVAITLGFDENHNLAGVPTVSTGYISALPFAIRMEDLQDPVVNVSDNGMVYIDIFFKSTTNTAGLIGDPWDIYTENWHMQFSYDPQKNVMKKISASYTNTFGKWGQSID